MLIVNNKSMKITALMDTTKTKEEVIKRANEMIKRVKEQRHESQEERQG